MTMNLGLHKFLFLIILFSSSGFAEPIKKQSATLKLLDKTSNKVLEKNVKVNSSISLGSLDIKIYSCYSSPPDEVPENYILLEVIDKLNDEKEYIYRGWMISSSPDITPLEHPIYDLWLVGCISDNAS
ncbi:MAG: hypothetical protein CFH15_00918 [Alphaproteobacteria bacterium MarineAlpha5_Bin5]|nr:MAG: hypothetical protein CFH15_00918 [Alphaproteobacteria bacterium MarineAlpha5_Bin5]PPR52288.1 MAG: hypothetical protein CFH14_00485 [Alphaproteobacteria bacterium MarineAlpha5_Bin4]